jgi:hypothetical protein
VILIEFEDVLLNSESMHLIFNINIKGSIKIRNADFNVEFER